MSKSNNERKGRTSASLNDPPNPNFIGYSDNQLREYIMSAPDNTGNLQLGVEAAQKELHRRELARNSFLT